MFEAIADYFAGPVGKLELLATMLLMINVYLLGQQRLSNYFFGFAGVVLLGVVLRASKLYSDMLLQWVFYAPLQIVGYFSWKHGRTLGASEAGDQPDSMQVVLLPKAAWPVLLLIIGSATWLLGAYMASNTDASFPYVDALTTCMSIAASILMLKKVLENWVLWILMDLIAIPVYFLKGLYVTAGLYVVFLALATLGLLRWLADYRGSAVGETADAR